MRCLWYNWVVNMWDLYFVQTPRDCACCGATILFDCVDFTPHVIWFASWKSKTKRQMDGNWKRILGAGSLHCQNTTTAVIIIIIVTTTTTTPTTTTTTTTTSNNTTITTAAISDSSIILAQRCCRGSPQDLSLGHERWQCKSVDIKSKIKMILNNHDDMLSSATNHRTFFKIQG